MAASAVFAKLNLKDQREIFILNAPDSFEREVAKLGDVVVRRKVTASSRVAFGLAFVTSQQELDAAAKALAPAAEGDAVIWLAYPKSTSKKYTSTLRRESGSDGFAKAGFESVRMIAIDEDWSAKRLRRAQYIKTMTSEAPPQTASLVSVSRLPRSAGRAVLTGENLTHLRGFQAFKTSRGEEWAVSKIGKEKASRARR